MFVCFREVLLIKVINFSVLVKIMQYPQKSANFTPKLQAVSAIGLGIQTPNIANRPVRQERYKLTSTCPINDMGG